MLLDTREFIITYYQEEEEEEAIWQYRYYNRKKRRVQHAYILLKSFNETSHHKDGSSLKLEVGNWKLKVEMN